MPTREISAIVAGTGFEGRASLIRAHCREGSPIDLRREPTNPHDPEAIAVWMRCNLLFGLVKTWKKIGYIKAARADGLAPKIDSGVIVVEHASVRSFYAPSGRDHPRVSLSILVSDKAMANGRRKP